MRLQQQFELELGGGSAARVRLELQLERQWRSATLNGAGLDARRADLPAVGIESEVAGPDVNYNPVGSGTGVADLQTATVDFAGSDPALKPADTSGDEGPGAPVPGRVRRDHGVLQPLRRSRAV